MAPVRSLTTELELRSDERGKWSVWFKGERIPGIVKINGDWENGTRAEITLTFIGAAVSLATDLPSGVFYRVDYNTLVDADGEPVAYASRFLSRFAEFPPYVPKIPERVFFIPEMQRFFMEPDFVLMGVEFAAQWLPRSAEFPQKHLTDAIDETFKIQNRKDDPTCTVTDREITIIP